MPQIEVELHPVDDIITNASGQIGQRTFYLQAIKGDQIVTLIVEKFQLQALAVAVEQFLADIQKRNPEIPEASSSYREEEMTLRSPLDPLFRVGDFGLGYDPTEDLIILVLRETIEEGTLKEAGAVRLWCSRSQLRCLTHWGVELANRGRPTCPLCGEVIEPTGHFCPKKNGHKKSRVVNEGNAINPE